MVQFNSILAHVNSQQPSDSVLECASSMARSHGAKLTLLDVQAETSWPFGWMTSGVEHAIEQVTHATQHSIHKLAESLTTDGLTVETCISKGRSSIAAIQEVMRHHHDLVITQARGRNSRREGWFGTTATRLIRKCPCPVLLVQSDVCWAERQVVASVAPVNLDSAHRTLDDRIIEHAIAICAPEAVPQVVTAWDMYLEAALKNHMKEEEFAELHARLRAEAEHHLDDLLIHHGMGIGSPNVHFLEGDPAHVVTEYVGGTENALLVMGTIGRAGLTGLLLGNTAEQLLSHAKCSLLAVKPEGFATPVKLPESSDAESH